MIEFAAFVPISLIAAVRLEASTFALPLSAYSPLKVAVSQFAVRIDQRLIALRKRDCFVGRIFNRDNYVAVLRVEVFQDTFRAETDFVVARVVVDNITAAVVNECTAGAAVESI